MSWRGLHLTIALPAAPALAVFPVRRRRRTRTQPP